MIWLMKKCSKPLPPNTILGGRIFLQVSSDLQKVLHELDEKDVFVQLHILAWKQWDHYSNT